MNNWLLILKKKKRKKEKKALAVTWLGIKRVFVP